MGNSDSKQFGEGLAGLVEDKAKFTMVKQTKTSLGLVSLLKDKNTGELSISKSKFLDEAKSALQAKLKFIQKPKKNCVPLLGLLATETSSNLCTASLCELRIPQYIASLHEIPPMQITMSDKLLWSLFLDINIVGRAINLGALRV
jgi:hypothetical protein